MSAKCNLSAKEIVAKLPLEKKAAMCSGKNFWELEAVEECGIPSVMVSDGPCGLRKQGDNADHLGLNESIKAISFPTGACIASSFDRKVFADLGDVLADECQAENLGVILGPAINIKRSPICGRNFEYISEDPYVTGELASAYINGVQAKNVGVSVKHFLANNQETRRMSNSSNMDERTLREIYMPGFEIAVKQSKPWTIMSSYNRLNGTFVGEDHRILTDILRGEWGFDGYVMSDWGAVNDRVPALKAGLDLEMPTSGSLRTQEIIDAVKNGTIDESVVDTACERILEISLRYLNNRTPDVKFDHERDHQFAADAAAESLVLLKNEDKVLPLNKNQKIAFIGKFAEQPRFQGGGSSHVNSYKVESPLDAAAQCGLNVTYAEGFGIDANSVTEPDKLANAVKAASEADAAVIFVGIPDVLESEGYERKDMKIPQCEVDVINAVSEVQKNVVVIVHCGGSIEMPWINNVKGVVYAYLAGEALGQAEMKVLTGEVNPSAKLTETFPIKFEDNPSYLFYPGEKDNTDYREGIFVGYRYYDMKKMPVLFPFGYGLSYTSFEYSDIKLSANEINDTDTLTVTAKVKNTGNVFGKEVVQLYVKNAPCTAIRPIREIKGFEKVALNPGEEKEVSFTLDKRSFAYYNTDISDWMAPTGVYSIELAKSSREICLQAEVKVNCTNAPKPVYSMNSTMGDVLENPEAAAKLMSIFGQSALGAMATKEDSDGGIGSDMFAMMKDMPLRALWSLSGGAMTYEQLQGILYMLNQ